MLRTNATRHDRRPLRAVSKPVEQDGPRVLSFPERVALFVSVLHKDRSSQLLEGLSEKPRQQASAFARQVTGWDSSTRQARLTHEFGVRTDALEQLHALVVRSPPGLRAALVEQLPEEWRRQFPHLVRAPTGPLAPALRALAARLVRETVR